MVISGMSRRSVRPSSVGWLAPRLAEHAFGEALGDAVGVDGDQRAAADRRVPTPRARALGAVAACAAWRLEAHEIAVLGLAGRLAIDISSVACGRPARRCPRHALARGRCRAARLARQPLDQDGFERAALRLLDLADAREHPVADARAAARVLASRAPASAIRTSAALALLVPPAGSRSGRRRGRARSTSSTLTGGRPPGSRRLLRSPGSMPSSARLARASRLNPAVAARDAESLAISRLPVLPRDAR